MKILIDIDEKDKRYIDRVVDNSFLNKPSVDAILNAVRNGTPLPKGYGDLVDISKLDGEWVCTHDGNYECIKNCSCEECDASEYQCYTDIRDLPIIVEADKESKE